MVPQFPKPPVAPHVNPAFFPEGPPVSLSRTWQMLTCVFVCSLNVKWRFWTIRGVLRKGLLIKVRFKVLTWRNVNLELLRLGCRLKPGLHDNFFGTLPVWIWPRCLKFSARHPQFLWCKWKNSWHECPETYGGRDYLSTWSRHSSVLGHSCHEFFHLHDKNEGCWAANFRHRGQIQTGTVPKKLSCKPGLETTRKVLPNSVRVIEA